MSNETKETGGQQKGLRGRGRMCVIIEPADIWCNPSDGSPI